MKKPASGQRLPPRQSDIIIRSDGTVSVSFLWDDLRQVVTGPDEQLPNLNKKSQRSSPPRRRGSRKNGSLGPRLHGDDRNFCSLAYNIEYSHCTLCPKRCGFDRISASHPLCGNSELRISTWGISHGDEPEIRGTRGSGAIMLGGCPLSCPSCHNPEMVRGGTPVSAETFLEIAASLNTGGAENLQVLSPTVHLPSLRLLLAELKKRGYGLPVALKSSGYEDVERLKPLEGLVDIYIPDLKYGPSSKWASKAGVPDYFEVACASIAEMYRQTGPAVMDRHGILQKGVLVRHVRAPLPKKERKAIDDYMAAMPEGVLVSVQSEFDVMD